MTDAKDLFEILMREHADMLLAFLRSSIRDPHAVDDIFQETMVVAWRRLDDFDRTRSFGKWIRGIAGKLVLAHFRKLGNRPALLDETTLDWLDSRFARVQSAPGDTLDDKLAVLRDCIASLPDEMRSTIEARYFHQRSLPEIVEWLHVSLDSVTKRLYRARLQLESCLDRKLPELEESA
ncbi:MAG: RNA polymerase sigma factor [Planctomycetota bacterium]